MVDIDTGQREEQGFTGALVAKSGEIAATAGAARAKALVEAAYLVAINRPRDVAKAEEEILETCKDYDFADHAIWSRIVGSAKNEDTGEWEDVWGEGLNIRFAEEAIQALGNIKPDSDLIYEDEKVKVFKITVTDLEKNVSYSKDVTINKTVERQKLRKGQVLISERKNSRGQITYTVAATEMDMRNKQAAAESLVMRTNGLRLVPARIKAKAMRQIKKTILAHEIAEPGVIGRLLESFSEFGATKEEMDKLLGHDIAQVTGEEIVKLRGLYRAIKDKETTWAETINSKVETKPASLDLNGLKPGDVSTHTEPDRVPTKPEPEPPPPEDEAPTGQGSDDAEGYFHAEVLKLLPKCNEDQYNALVDSAFVDCELSAWEECELNPKYRQRLVDWCTNHLAGYVTQMKKGKK